FRRRRRTASNDSNFLFHRSTTENSFQLILRGGELLERIFNLDFTILKASSPRSSTASPNGAGNWVESCQSYPFGPQQHKVVGTHRKRLPNKINRFARVR